MTQATATQIRLAYDDAGQGEPALLFLPGWCVPRTVFSDLAARGGRHRHVLALDWRGHGESDPPGSDFGEEGLVEDALTVIRDSGVRRLIPVALSHAGWVALELRRRLGPRIEKVVAIDWMILEAPQHFLETLQELRSQRTWRRSVQGLVSQWARGVDNPRLARFLRDEIGTFGFDMWARAAREIIADYEQAGAPLRAFAELSPPVPLLHLYAQPDDPGYLQVQKAFSAGHPWFSVEKLAAGSHFPMFEAPDAMAAAIERFARS